MYPVLFKFWIFEFHTYTVLMAGAFLLGAYLFFRHNERLAEPYGVTPMGALWLFAGILVGSKVYYILEYREAVDLLSAVRIWEGGLVSYGGILGGAVAAIAYLRYKRAPILPICDLAVSYVPLCHAIGRLGCFFNGCCWGKPTDLPWGVVYPEGTPLHKYLFYEQTQDGLITAEAAHPHAVHPTQLYESLGLFVIYLILCYLYPRRRRDGGLLLLYPVFYGALRFVVEFFRADPTHPFPVLGLRLSQGISLGLVIMGLMVYITVRTRLPKRGVAEATLEATNGVDAQGS